MTNDGNPFEASDWSRLKRIAEGNPDETKIGAFGVGFYSVFADCEEPFVRSGNESMAFYWKRNSLFTKRLRLSEEQSSSETNFVLNYRNTTSPVPNLLPLCQFLASSITFVGLTQVDLWMNEHRLLSLTKLTAPSVGVKIPKSLETKTHEGLHRVESVVYENAQLEARWLNIVAWKPKAVVNYSSGNVQSATVRGGSSTPSLRSFFSRFAVNVQNPAEERAAKEEKISQDAISEDLGGECKATVFLHVNTATIRSNLNATFKHELERATKKPPPASTKLAILTSSYAEKAASMSSITGTASKSTDIFASVLPSKSGRIFIGFPTHQTTGLSAHISAQSVVPTVERESIDLNARWVRTWNMEMLRAAGIVSRIAWTGEINTLKEKLVQSSMFKDSKKSKPSAEEIDKVLPEAIYILNQFTFQESTPSSQVGSLVEEAFWTCNETATIEILSTHGILPSQEVRIATETLSFVDGIPVLPSSLMQYANGFVKKLVDYGIITDITTSDIKKELERQAINENQLIEFLKWLGHKSRVEEISPVIVRSLLDVTVANQNTQGNTTHGKVIVLSEIKHFINPSKIPGNVPIPPNTLPFEITKNITRVDLEAFGWEDLQIVPWLRWLVESTGETGQLSKEQDVTQSASFAAVVLPVVSKQWDGLSQSSKNTVVSLLNTRTVIPTKFGMRRPTDAYFPSVRLFEDLPIVSGLQSVKEKFLIALGVRKTVELGLVFNRLMAPPDFTEDAALARPAWSHVDLIKYLASVHNDIPSDDVKRLKDTPMCPAVSRDGKALQQRYRVAELYEPNEIMRSLGLRLLQWPGIYRPGSEEGKFLRLLGLRSTPSVAELIPMIASAASNGDISQRDHILKYFVTHHAQNGYSVEETAATQIRYLPLESTDSKASVLPTQCYTNKNATILGFNVLRTDLYHYAARLGVEANPPVIECVQLLIKEPPNTKRRACEIFEYFATRLGDMNGGALELLKEASFVPVFTKAKAVRPSLRYLPPRLCFLGDSDNDKYKEIFDFVDFGMNANSFLLRCGSKHEPSTLELAQLVVREPARIFTVFESPERYLDLLRNLAIAWPNLRKDKTLVKDMKKMPFLLAYKEVPSDAASRSRRGRLVDVEEPYGEDDDVGVRTYELAIAAQTVVVDDVISYNLFKGNFLAIPMEEDLENFCIALGAATLSSLVEQKLQIGQAAHDQRDGTRLERLIRERIKLFMHEIPRDQIRHDASWIERNLSIVVINSLAVRKSLTTGNVSHTEPRTAVQAKDLRIRNKLFAGYTLFVTPGIRDLYDVGQALSTLLLTRPKPQHAITLTVLLETDLHKLRARGYNVERILQKKAAEARVADEQRRKQLEEEQQIVKDQESSRSSGQKQLTSGMQNDHSMPGLFPDSPDRRIGGMLNQSDSTDTSHDRLHEGFLAALHRTFGGQYGSHLPQLGESGPIAPPPYSHTAPQQRELATTTPPQPVTSPQELQQNLSNAIKASRAHNSQSVVSQPHFNNVHETQTFCDAKPAQNISFFTQSSTGVKIYLSHKILDKQSFMNANSAALNNFASILLDCAGCIGLAKASLHIFQDDESSTIAFNQNKSLFFNYRYFETLHLPGVLQTKRDGAIVYWFVVMCHELAHNLVADHSSAHSYYT